MPIRAVIFDLMDELLLVEDRGVWHTWGGQRWRR